MAAAPTTATGSGVADPDAAGRRGRRRQAGHDERRQRILAAARAVATRHGVAAATMRAVADEAGYVAGALYAYYASRDALLADLAVAVLTEIGRAVRGEADQAAILLDHFRRRPADRDLLMAVLGGPAEAIPDDAARAITGRIIGLLRPVAEELESAGYTQGDAAAATVGLFAEFLGLLLLDGGGYLRRLGFRGESLLQRRAANLLRLAPRRSNG